MVENLLEFSQYRTRRGAEYLRLKALEKRGEKIIRKASVSRVIKPILYISYNMISLYAVSLRFVK